MSVDTDAERARSKTRNERDTVEKKRAGYRRFVAAVEQTPTDTPAATGVGPTAFGAVTTASSVGSKGCTAVRERFAETVAAHHTVDVDRADAPIETVAAELSEGVAVALAPANGTASFTEGLKSRVVSEATTRQHELRVMERALGIEAASLSTANDALGEVTDWLVETNETPLTECGFDALAERHDRLTAHRESCASVARERQSLLQTTTSVDATAGLSQLELVGGLYESFPVAYPVLSTATRLDALCRDCQGVVRDHLVRRA